MLMCWHVVHWVIIVNWVALTEQWRHEGSSRRSSENWGHFKLSVNEQNNWNEQLGKTGVGWHPLMARLFPRWVKWDLAQPSLYSTYISSRDWQLTWEPNSCDGSDLDFIITGGEETEQSYDTVTTFRFKEIKFWNKNWKIVCSVVVCSTRKTLVQGGGRGTLRNKITIKWIINSETFTFHHRNNI